MTLKPVVPFEPVRVDDIPAGIQWVGQVKWDGVRILTYADGSSVRLFNRRLNERTLQFPELANIQGFCKSASVVLDGEAIAMEKGRPSFHAVMKRDSVRQAEKVPPARRETPVVYMIFDILFHGGEWVTGRTLRERQDLLKHLIIEGDEVRLVENFIDPEPLWQIVKARGLEGIVCKDLNSTYAVNGKDARWQKVKNYRDLVAVVGGVTRRGSLVTALLLGQFDRDGRLWYIGHAGTGRLTAAEWRAFSETVGPLFTRERPFVNKPERIKEAQWVRPVFTVKIKFMEWTSGHTMRQPSIQAFVSVPPETCILE